MRSFHAVLGAFLASSVTLAACGDNSGQAPPPKAPETTAPNPSAPSVSPTTPMPPATAMPTTPPSHGAMKPIAATTMVADLKALGLDAKALPALNKMDPATLRKVMVTFKKSLGVECTGCHDGGDFKASTPHKKVAAKMWDEFVRGLAMENGDPVYCDSCHGGHMEFLDRHDKKALSAWMDDNYVSKLKRADKKDHGCETCHGPNMDMNFLAKWEK